MRALKPMNRNPSKKEHFKTGSSNKKRRLLDDGHFAWKNGGTSSSKSQRISTRRSKRLENCNPKETQKSATILSWLVDSKIVPDSATIYYTGTTTQDGFKKGTIEANGIVCACCRSFFTVPGFQVHTGGRIIDNPYDAIGVDGIQGDGSITPLSQCMESALKKRDEPEHHGIKHVTTKETDGDIYDDACMLCADGGNLICCEQCNSTFHEKCLGMQVVPDEPYYCSYCACKLCGKPITKRDSSWLTCSLCEKQYHVKCSKESLTIDINRFPRAFCEKSCRSIHEKLESKLGVKRMLEDDLSWTLLHRFDREYGSYEVGATKRLECYSKLAVAFRLFTACFEPIRDRHTRINMIRNVVYNCGSDYQRINFRRFFTGIIEKGDEVIAVASIRVHGSNLAEIPFIATAERHRNKGMCGKLLSGIESVSHGLRLGYLFLFLDNIDLEKYGGLVIVSELNRQDLQDFGVRTLVIPSSSETIRVWNEKYGFNLLKEETKKEIMKLNVLMFHDCLRMQKTIRGYTFLLFLFL
ncbi:increased DNA methylation 1 [Lactuca sativa]|uniref:increased DNA methylation 1 n=1 Tax=Lactuca sativa TaxID=4236 RepID=UPI000CD7EC48|nr:increased DNA methylation 1 [Lactuca sativa]